MVASLLTCSGASVGVSISTQRRMPSRMVWASNGLEAAVLDMPLRTSKKRRCHFKSGPSNVQKRCRGMQNARAKPLASLAMKIVSSPVGALARGDLLDHVDNAAAELGVGNAGESADQRQAFRCRKEIGN